MTINGSLLQTLHRILRQKSDITGQLVRGPKQVQAAKNKLETAQQHLNDKREQQKQMRMSADRKQLQLREREQKLVGLHGKLNAAKENREYQALKEQIAADKQANNVLSDEILEILESLDTIKAEIATGENRVVGAQKELAEIESQVGARMATLQQDLDRVNAELAHQEVPLSGEFRREYERLVLAKGEDGLAEVDGECCGGCYQILTPHLLDKLGQNLPAVCPSCGCLLYQNLERSSGVR